MHFREIGLNIASGIISLGKCKIFNNGVTILIIISIIPDALNAPIAINKPTNVGTNPIVISIASFAPSIKSSNTVFLDLKE